MTAIAKAAASLAAFAYLDAKHGIAADLHLGRAANKAEWNHRFRVWRNKISLYYFFDGQVNKQPDSIAYVYNGVSFTWKQVSKDVNRLAHYILSQGVKPGDRIAVFMGNSVALVEWWLACMAVNVTPAFINNGLTGKGLVHCIKVSQAPLVVFEPYLAKPLADIQDELESETAVRKFLRYDDGITPHDGGEKPASASSGAALRNVVEFGPSDLAAQSDKRLPDSYRDAVDESTPSALIYTSGTTGLPKAALCSHGRMGGAVIVWPTMNKFGPKDRIYTPMPLYHSSALYLCIGASMYTGSTVIIGRKFSARGYWEEVRKYDATVVQYIGEIARYLLAVPPGPEDKNHKVRLAYGNGMRPDVWEKFRERFGVRVIAEFFAASEGNGGLVNYNTGPFGAGAVGRMGKLAKAARPDFKIVQVDPITEDIYRDPATGRCVECGPLEPGEFIMRIGTTAVSRFQGYAGNPEATKKKVLTDVFVKGDNWFRSGDLMSQDADGFFYFGDRLGDTFRWRSENVSTTEVSAALGQAVGEANVYGVLVPGHDGRAGCAAIPADEAAKIDFRQLAAIARKSLPKYAVPLFLRIVPQMESTGTVKQQKVLLRNQGIHHDQCGNDKLFWLPPNAEGYVPFLPEHLKAIESGSVRL